MDEDTLTALAGPAPAPKPSGQLAGKVCLVTGGASGIGRATALRMAQEGAKAVVIAGRRAALGEAVAEELRAAGTEGVFVAADVTREADAAALIAAVLDRFGRLDAVFNNAGLQEKRAPLAEQTDAVYGQVFDTNIRALFFAMRHQIPALLAGGGGTIVNNTSVSGLRNPNPGLSLYSASKAAALMLTRSAAMEYAPHGIRINAVGAGPRGDGHDAGLGHRRYAAGRGRAAAASDGAAGGGRGRGVLATVGRGQLRRREHALRGWRVPGGVIPHPGNGYLSRYFWYSGSTSTARLASVRTTAQ
jgi:NAD(P)-dependent dehydrogenase (short-subunit alcohol dehydrogenase family)